MRHVSPCGYISPGIRPVVAVSGVLVHSVEGYVIGLHGSRPGAHDVPWDVKSASLEKFVPPWTVKRLVWTDSLKPCHSGPREVCTAVDGLASNLDGFSQTLSFGGIY